MLMLMLVLVLMRMLALVFVVMDEGVLQYIMLSFVFQYLGLIKHMGNSADSSSWVLGGLGKEI